MISLSVPMRVAAAALFIGASSAMAQDVPLIQPGDARLHPERLEPSRVGFYQVITRDGQEPKIGLYGVNAIDRFPHDEYESVVLTQMVMNTIATSTNELRLRGDTFAPVWSDEASLETNGRIVSYYSDATIHTVVADPEVEATERETELAYQSFDMLQVPYVLATMDLTKDDEFVFSVVDPRDERVFFMRCKVLGQTTILDSRKSKYEATRVQWQNFGSLELATGEHDWSVSPAQRTYNVSSESPHWLGNSTLVSRDGRRVTVEFKIDAVDMDPVVSFERGLQKLQGNN
jgi:hypothetical protein